MSVSVAVYDEWGAINCVDVLVESDDAVILMVDTRSGVKPGGRGDDGVYFNDDDAWDRRYIFLQLRGLPPSLSDDPIVSASESCSGTTIITFVRRHEGRGIYLKPGL